MILLQLKLRLLSTVLPSYLPFSVILIIDIVGTSSLWSKQLKAGSRCNSSVSICIFCHISFILPIVMLSVSQFHTFNLFHLQDVNMLHTFPNTRTWEDDIMGLTVSPSSEGHLFSLVLDEGITTNWFEIWYTNLRVVYLVKSLLQQQ